MVPVVPTLILIGGPGTDDDLFLSIDRKFREPFERKFKQMGANPTGKTTTYGSGDIVYADADVVINISGTEYNVGAPADISDLLSRLKNLDIGWWVEHDGKLVVRGFQTYGDLTQDGAAVASPDTDQNNGTVLIVTDLIRELALKISNVPNLISTTAWLLDGNDLLVEKFIGTISNHAFPIRANNLEVARGYTTGEFGVGISTTPLGTLHVTGRTGQSAAYFANAALTDSWEFRNDGAVYRDSLLYSVPSGTDTTYGQRAGFSIVTQDHNCLFGFECALNLTPGSGNGENNVIVGANAAVTLTTGSNNTILGYLADVSTAALSASIALGTRTTITASNQWVVGATNFPLTDAYFGQGELSTAPVTFTLHGSNASGANVAAGNFQYAVGQSRGAGVSGKHIFRNTKTGGGASVLQSHYDTLTIDSTYVSLSPHGTGVGNTFELRYLELAASGTDYIGWKAPDARTSNTSLIIVLPPNDPTVGQVMAVSAPVAGVSTGSWVTPLSSGSSWLLDGNTVGSEKFIGTLDNFDFPIRTNNVENVVVFATGQTGFGISASPLGKVHIEGISGGYALYTEFNAGATQNWSIRDDGELRYASARGAFINGSAPSQTYFGFNAGINLSDGNTGFGAFVLSGTGAAIENVAMGGNAGFGVTTGNGSVFYGYNSGNAIVTPNGANRVAITTGFNNTFIGQRTGGSAANRSDSIAIGCYAMTTANNQCVIGGTADNAEYYGVNDVYIGQGVSLEATSMGQFSINVQTTGISAGQTDISAAVSYLAWCSAVGTGTGIGGDIRFYSAPAGSTGTARNALFRQIDWRGDGLGVNFYQKSTPLVVGASVTDGFIMYSNDRAGAGTASPFFRTENGTVIDVGGLASTTKLMGTFVWTGGNGITVAAGLTVYAAVGFNSTFNGTETNRNAVVPYAFTAKNLYVRTKDAQPAAGSLVITLMKNGAATAVTLTIAAAAGAGTFTDLVNTVDYAAGDTISLRIVNNDGATTSAIFMSGAIAAVN